MLATRRTIARMTRRDGVRQIALVLAAFAAYESARLAIEPNWPAAIANAHRIADLERMLALGFERQVQAAFLAIPDLVKALNLFYFVGHFVLTGIFFVWLYHRSRDGFRSFRDGFLVATAIAVVVHWQFPTAPPRLADVGLLDTLRTLSGIDIGSQASTALSNPVFAVPSLHAGYAAGVGLGLLAFGRRLATRVVGVLYPALVTLTIIVTGNHFVFDAIAGVLVMALGFAAAIAWHRWRGDEAPLAACASR
jgi:PAP2 superfamily